MGLAARKPDTQPLTDWSWNAWRPSCEEWDYEIDEIEGKIPDDLTGTLYRNGPSQQIIPEQGYGALHFFDGDGMVHAFRMEEGRAWYRNRVVRNASFESEQAAGRCNQNFIGSAVSEPDPSIMMRQQPNTNVIHFGGKLLAMVENSHPFELDPRTLAPMGPVDFGSGLTGPWLSAHPRIDPRTGQMLIHGYFIAEPYCQFYVIEPDGRVSLAENVDVGYPTFMHDNAVTENYFITIAQPVTLEPEWSETGPIGCYGDWMTWRPEKGLRFGVQKREAGAPVKWFDAPTPYGLFHVGNAFECDGKILMDACMYTDGPGWLEALRVMRNGTFTEGTGATPFLYELDLATGTCKENQLSEKTSEWPRIDPRLVGYQNRFGYAVEAEENYVVLTNSELRLIKYDRETGSPAYHDFGNGQFPGEPVFVPAKADGDEDEGYVLVVVFDAPEDRSYLAILDAQNFSSAPLAKLRLRGRVPAGFHGNWTESYTHDV